MICSYYFIKSCYCFRIVSRLFRVSNSLCCCYCFCIYSLSISDFLNEDIELHVNCNSADRHIKRECLVIIVLINELFAKAGDNELNGILLAQTCRADNYLAASGSALSYRIGRKLSSIRSSVVSVLILVFSLV